ncbi:MAG: ribosome small subunit-dependent GTPase A [Planctomycetes bacterium]|nr:ribosome small subunit-dependent GTPase A [Planctomycetota bacterium]
MTDEFHKRSHKSRKNQEKRITAHFAQRRTPEERKRLLAESRRRRTERKGAAPRRRAWDDDDEAPTFESMTLAHGHVASRPAGGSADGDPIDAPVQDELVRDAPAHDDDRVAADARAGDACTQDACAGDACAPDGAREAARTGRVVSIARGRLTLSWTHGVVDAAPPSDAGTSPAVGDLVDFATREGHLRVARVHPRRSELVRSDPGNLHARRVLAANVDVAVLVLACARPAFKPGLVDRVLLALGGSGIGLVVVANKSDLLDDGAARTAIEERLAPYPSLGVPVLLASARSGEGRDALQAHVRGRTAVFVGHSGVGKSSLLNLLDPEGRRRTRAGREGDGKGRHTTTASTLTELSDGTLVIDTPGVRAFGLWDVDAATLRDAFPELVAHAGGCRFRDCSHLVEPDCAVRAAVETGAIPRARWDAYARIHASL